MMKQTAQSTPPSPESLAGQVRRAILWRSGSQITGQLVSWTATFLQRAGSDVVVASLVPQAAFGTGVAGALRLRVSRGDATGDWQELARIVRLADADRVRPPGRDRSLPVVGA